MASEMTYTLRIDTSRVRQMIQEAGGVESAAYDYAARRNCHWPETKEAFAAGAEWLLGIVEKSFDFQPSDEPRDAPDSGLLDGEEDDG
jgi:hypothetical protein